MNFTKINAVIPKIKEIRLNLRKKFGGIKARININIHPNISLIAWFLAQGSHEPPDAEYKEAIPTNPSIITLKKINQLIFNNFDNKILLRVSLANLF